MSEKSNNIIDPAMEAERHANIPVIQQICATLADDIAERYHLDDTRAEEELGAVWLRQRVERALIEAPDSEARLAEIEETFNEFSDVYEEISLKEIMASALARRDLFTALQDADSGKDLAWTLGLGLSDEDLRNLALLHRDGWFRGKIEELLTECDFHNEELAMEQGHYDQFLEKEER